MFPKIRKSIKPTNDYCPITFSGEMTLFIQYSKENVIGYDRDAYLHFVLELNGKEPLLHRKLKKLSIPFYNECCCLYFRTRIERKLQRKYDNNVTRLMCMIFFFVMYLVYCWIKVQL